MGAKLRRIFLAGIFTAIPVYVTYKVLEIIFQFMDRFLAPVVQPIIIHYLGFSIPGLGLVMMIIALFLLGLFVTNFLGRALYGYFEKIVVRIPIASNVYSFAKQIVQTFSRDQRSAFLKVVWLQYPRQGLWALGFVTGTSQSEDGESHYNIFVPTTPNPTSGYVVFMAQKDTIEADLSIEEGFKLLISGGALSRGSHRFRYDKTQGGSLELPEAGSESGDGSGSRQ
ncbi:MAG: DUF502 domain-containing protein [Fidelibacterota bacterium]|nr:MAG: DUF502 domain-containing protein [Candidatus Neomarinimicrobiota bacterium]